MAKRGKVLRDTSAGPGLLMVDGKQHTFALEGLWQSSVPPAVGMTVDVDLDPAGEIAGIRAVSDSQIAKEQTEQALAAAKTKSRALASSAVARFGMPTLIATAVLIVGWFFLTTISIHAGFLGKIDFTFWRVLAFVNAKNAFEALGTLKDGGSVGIYGLLAFIALAGPFLAHFWKDKKAALGGLLPLLFMLLVVVLVRSSINSAIGDVPAEAADAARGQIMKQFSIGFGAYLSLLAALYLAFLGVKNFLLGKAKG